MDSVYFEFGRRLRAARTEKGLSQTHVARYVGLSRTSITNIERGRQRFPLHLVYQLAEAVGIPAKDLLPAAKDEVGLPAELLSLPEKLQQWALSLKDRSEASRQ